MREAREFAEWSRTAAMMAKMHNLQTVNPANIKQPADFHPHLVRKQKQGGLPFSNEDRAKLAKRAFGCK